MGDPPTPREAPVRSRETLSRTPTTRTPRYSAPCSSHADRSSTATRARRRDRAPARCSRARSSSCSASRRRTGTRCSRRRLRTRCGCSSSSGEPTCPLRQEPTGRSSASSSSRRTSTARAASTGPSLPAAAASPVPDDAVAFIAERVGDADKPITLVATGPLTNVARYLAAHWTRRDRADRAHGRRDRRGQLHPGGRVQHLGAIPRLRQPVLASGLDVTMIGLDVTHQAFLGPRCEERLRAAGRVGSFVADLNVYFSATTARRTAGTAHRSTTRSPSAHVIRPGLVETRVPQRRGRARVRALPRANRRRPLGAHATTPPNAHVGVRPRRRRRSSISSSGGSGASRARRVRGVSSRASRNCDLPPGDASSSGRA